MDTPSTVVEKMRKEEEEKKGNIESLREMESILRSNCSQDTDPFILSCNMGGSRKYKVPFSLDLMRESKMQESLKSAREILERKLEEFYNQTVGKRGSTIRQALDWIDFTTPKKEKKHD